MSLSKHDRPSWWFAEYAPVGVELGTAEAVAAYDERQGTNANSDNALLDRLGVGDGTRLIDLACGTGAFAIRAALRGADAHGVDVSEAMIDHGRRSAAAAGVDVSWHHAGFLDHRHPGPPADVVTTRSALHQLPDAWKQQALLNAASMLRPGGTFYVWDATYSFAPENADAELERWITEMGQTSFSAKDFETHIREEFSTYTWIVEGLLHRAGLRIIEHATHGPTYAEFVCRRE